MSAKLRVAVVGLGVGKGHLEAYAEIPDFFEVKAVCDLNADKARSTAVEFGVAWHTTSLADLLSSAEVDMIDLCTPPNTHRGLIEQALAAGKHVVCEKPLVGSLLDVDAVAAALRGSTGQLFPIFQYRFGNGLQRLKHLQAKGLARHALITTMETHWRRDSDYYAIPWRGKWATEMGGVCLTQACHGDIDTEDAAMTKEIGNGLGNPENRHVIDGVDQPNATCGHRSFGRVAMAARSHTHAVARLRQRGF